MLKNFSAGLIGRLLSQTVSFVLVIYLARVLGPETYGSISVVLAIISYFNLLATFGLPTVGIREAAGKQNPCAESISQIFSVGICLAPLAYLLLFAYGWFFITDIHLLYLLLLYGLTILSSSWLLDWAFIGMEDLRSLAVANVMGSLCSCIFIFLLVKDATDILYIPIILFAGAVLSCAFLFYLFHKVHSLHLRFTLMNCRPVLKLAMPFAITGGLSLVYENFDIIMLGFMASHQEAGYYSVAYRIVSVLSAIIGIYSQSTFPVMVRLHKEGPQCLGAFLQQNIHCVLYFMLPVLTGGTILGSNIIGTFFGEAYLQATTPFILLLYYVFFMALSIMLANWLLAVNEDKKYMTTLILGSVMNVIANLVLIPLLKSVGAAVAMIITEVFVLCFLVMKIRAVQQLDWVDKKLLFILAGSCAGMGISIFTMQELFQVHVGFLILAGAIVYFGLSLPFCARFIRRTITE